MKLFNLGSNQTEVEMASGMQVFFSYSTPVAAFIPGRGYIRTDKHWSVTTSRHINKWLDGQSSETVSQATIDALI